MGERLRERKGHKAEKKVELEKDEKEFQKAKKKDRVVGKDRKADDIVEDLKTSGVEGEENTNVEINGRKDSGDNLEERQEKKKRRKENKKKGVDGTLSEFEGVKDGKRGELDKGPRKGENRRDVDVPVENGEEEGAKKTMKKKKGKEDGDNEGKDIVTDGEKLSKERNQMDGRIKEDGKLAVKEKNLKKVCDKVKKATEKREVEEVEDEMKADEEGGGSEMKKKKKRKNVDKMKTNEEGDRGKKKKRKSEKASDELEEEMKSNEEGEKSRRKKEKKRGNASVEGEKEMETDVEGDRSKKKKRRSEKASNEMEDEMRTNEEGGKSKKKKERKRDNAPAEVEDEMETSEENASVEGEARMETNEEGDGSKKKKKERKKENVSDDVEDKMKTDEGAEKSKKKKERKRENVSGDVEDKSDELGKGDDGSKDKKKKGRAEKQVSSGKAHKGKARTEEDTEATDTCESPTPQGKSKRVSFSDHVEVFLDDSPSGGESVSNEGGEGLVRGKRFTREEDELVKKAILGYIEDHSLGEDGLNMILNCISYPEIKGCWTEIAAALPWRPRASVYHRGHVLFERDDRRKWTAEEFDYIREFYKKHGADWKKLSVELNKHRFHCKDTWRRIKLANLKKGHWSQEEYQGLFDLVNMDLRMRALEERKSKHGMLRDNICWESISDRLSTRNNSTCCTKWYKQLTSPMVRQGLWADTDDYRLLDALSSLDATCMEDVDWDTLLEHRDGELCRKRWNQMVKHIGEYGLKSFSEQVEILANRYSPDCIEAREEFDSKPILP